MIWLLKYWKVLALVGAAATLVCAGWWQGSDRVQRKWDVATAKQVKAQLEKNVADATKLRTLEETKNENLVEIDRLRANNHAIWLRLPKTPCGGSGAPSGDTIAGGGELPTPGESYLAGAKRQLDDEAHRADAIVEGCRVINDFVR